MAGVLVPLPAYAEDALSPSAEATAVAETVAELTPAALQIPEEEIVEPVSLGEEGFLVAGDLDEAAAILPLEGDGAISFGAGVEIGLPEKAETGDGLVAEDGSVSYAASDEGAASVTVITSGEGTRINTVITDASASHEYTYSLGSGEPRLLPDGSVEIYGSEDIVDDAGQEATVESLLGSVDAAWAVDANGEPVPTRYEVRGQDLVQIVDFTEDTAFPVVADPSLWWVIGTASDLRCRDRFAGGGRREGHRRVREGR